MGATTDCTGRNRRIGDLRGGYPVVATRREAFVSEPPVGAAPKGTVACRRTSAKPAPPRLLS